MLIYTSNIGTCFIKKLLLLIFIFGSNLIHSQSTDSLLRLFQKEKIDTAKVILLNQICKEYGLIGEPVKALDYGRQALKLARSINYKSGIANAHNLIGFVLVNQGNLNEALNEQLKSLQIFESIGDKKAIANGNISLGSTYFYHTNYSEALKFYLKSLKIYKEIKDSDGVATAYIGIGAVNEETGKYQEALNNYNYAVKIKEKLGNDKNRLAITYMNLGNVYSSLGKYEDALSNLFKALKIREQLSQTGGKGGVLISIGNLYLKQGRINESEKYIKEGIECSQQAGSLVWANNGYFSLVKIDSSRKDFKSAFNNYKIAIKLRDSIKSAEVIKKSVQIAMQNEFDKKELIAKVEQDKKDAISKEQLKQKEKEQNYFIAGIIVIALFSLLVLRSYSQKRKANIIISEQKKEVEESKKEIVDSIHYAKRIQKALIPSEKYIAKNLNRLKDNGKNKV